MQVWKTLISCLSLCILSPSIIAHGRELTWENLGQVFRERFKEHAAEILESEQIAAKYEADRFHLNPSLSTTGTLLQKTRANTKNYEKTLNVGASQTFPTGTTLEAGTGLVTSSSPDKKSTSFTGAVSQELLKGGPWWGNISSAQAEASAATQRLRLENIVQEKFSTLAVAVIDAQLALIKRNVVAHQLEVSRTQKKETEALIASGYKTPSDGYAMESSVIGNESKLASAEITIQNTLATLNNLLFIKKGEEEYTIATGPIPAKIQQILHGNAKESLSYKTAEAALKEVMLEVKVSERDTLPQLTAKISAERGLLTGKTFQETLNPTLTPSPGAGTVPGPFPETPTEASPLPSPSAPVLQTTRDKSLSFTYSLSFVFPLRDTFTRDNLTVTRLKEKKSRRELDLSREQASFDEQKSARDYLSAQNDETASKKMLDIEKKVLKGEEEKYKAGTISSLSLQDTRSKVDTAELTIFDAEAATRKAVLSLAKTRGNLLEAFNIANILEKE